MFGELLSSKRNNEQLFHDRNFNQENMGNISLDVKRITSKPLPCFVPLSQHLLHTDLKVCFITENCPIFFETNF